MDTILFGSYEVAASVVPCLFLYGMKKKDREKGMSFFTLATSLLFALYIIAVYHVTEVGTMYDVGCLPPEGPNISLLPFSNDIDFVGYLLNIVMLMPFGFFLPCMRKVWDKPLRITLMGALFSTFIETAQLFNHRATDIDDVIMNTIGAYFGYLLYRVFRKKIQGMRKKQECPACLAFLIIVTGFAGRFLLYNTREIAELLYYF